jgi:riboflavin kinase/FMN adenylyltransferase
VPYCPPFRLTSLDQRERLFAAGRRRRHAGVRLRRGARRDQRRGLRGELLAERIGAAGVVTGEDFTFGAGAAAMPTLLRELGAAHGLAAERWRRCCSTASRSAPAASARRLPAGDPGTATRLLTRPFAIRAWSSTATSAGASLAIRPPTWRSATISARPTASMRCGCGCRRRSEHAGVASLGVRPTFEPPQELLETYLFDLVGRPLRPQEIEVALHHFLRPEQKFELDALARRCAEDEAEAADCWRWT